MEDHHPCLRVKCAQRGFELHGLVQRFLHKILVDVLAEGAEGTAAEAAPESLHARETDSLDLDACPIEQVDAALDEKFCQPPFVTSFEVVVTKHRYDRKI